MKAVFYWKLWAAMRVGRLWKAMGGYGRVLCVRKACYDVNSRVLLEAMGGYGRLWEAMAVFYV